MYWIGSIIESEWSFPEPWIAPAITCRVKNAYARNPTEALIFLSWPDGITEKYV